MASCKEEQELELVGKSNYHFSSCGFSSAVEPGPREQEVISLNHEAISPTLACAAMGLFEQVFSLINVI